MAEEQGTDWGSVFETGSELVKTGLGLYENLQSRKEAGKLGDAYWYGVKAIQAVTPPELQDLTITLQRYVEQGRLTPEEAIAQLQEQSAMRGLSVPQEILKVQYQTLNELQNIVNNKGLTPLDRAAINNIQTELDTAARGQRLATQQSFAQRGLSGSGMELVQQQMADQAAAQRGSQAGLNIAAQAQQRALDALRQQGSYSTQMAEQELGRQRDVASAQDAINRFNAAARQQAELANVERRQSVQEKNLAEKQRIADLNVLQQQKQQEADAAAKQKVFENKLRQAEGVGAVTAQAGQGIAAAQETKKAASGGAMDDLGNIIDIGTKLYSIFSDEDMKKDKNYLGNDELTSLLDRLIKGDGNVLHQMKARDAVPLVAPMAKHGGVGQLAEALGVDEDISGVIGTLLSDKNMKKDKNALSDQNVEDVLNSLTGYTFKYKPETNLGDELHAGVMAQDMEKTPMGEDIVVDTPSGKQIKGKEAMSFALAALANINNRINKLEK